MREKLRKCECGGIPELRDYSSGNRRDYRVFYWYACRCGRRTFATMDLARVQGLWNDRRLEGTK